MTFEYKMTQPDAEQDVEELKSVLTVLEENHKIELAKETPNDDVVADLEAKITAKRTEYEALGGTYD